MKKAKYDAEKKECHKINTFLTYFSLDDFLA